MAARCCWPPERVDERWLADVRYVYVGQGASGLFLLGAAEQAERATPAGDPAQMADEHIGATEMRDGQRD